MHFLGFVIKTIGTIIAFVIAVKVVAIVLALLGLALKLVWLAACVGFFALIAYGLYRLIAPRNVQQV